MNPSQMIVQYVFKSPSPGNPELRERPEVTFDELFVDNPWLEPRKDEIYGELKAEGHWRETPDSGWWIERVARR